MGVKGWLCLLVRGLCGCGSQTPAEISRIALLAPFEGRYREIGYDAYYAVQLAIRDSHNPNIELLAVDDGGTTAIAIERAKALAKDPQVKAVLALGYAATNSAAQQALAGLPVIIIGEWGAKPASKNVFALTNPQISRSITIPGVTAITEAAAANAPLIGGDMLALRQFVQLRLDIQGIRIASSGSLADEAFRERYLQSGLFVPEPGLLATLTYDAANLILEAIPNGDVQGALEKADYEGINGLIRFADGYWADAPIHYYCFRQEVSIGTSIGDRLSAC